MRDKRNKLEATRKKGTFVGYCENSKSFRIYTSHQRKINFSKDVMFDEDVSLGNEMDLPQPKKKYDNMDVLGGPTMPESKKDVIGKL